jgi:hypothetical protein
MHGGIGSWFVVLFGLICLVTAALFTWRPDEGRLAVLRAMSLATGFSMLGGFVAGVAKSMDGCSALPPGSVSSCPSSCSRESARPAPS